jgi:hypothetical protein
MFHQDRNTTLGHCLGELGSFGTGHGRIRPRIDDAERIIANAVTLMECWPDKLVAQLNHSTSKQPIRKEGTLLDRMLGPAQHFLTEELQSNELTFVRVAYEQQLLVIWKTFGKSFQLKRLDRQLELDFGKW